MQNNRKRNLIALTTIILLILMIGSSVATFPRWGDDLAEWRMSFIENMAKNRLANEVRVKTTVSESGVIEVEFVDPPPPTKAIIVEEVVVEEPAEEAADEAEAPAEEPGVFTEEVDLAPPPTSTPTPTLEPAAEDDDSGHRREEAPDLTGMATATPEPAEEVIEIIQAEEGFEEPPEQAELGGIESFSATWDLKAVWLINDTYNGSFSLWDTVLLPAEDDYPEPWCWILTFKEPEHYVFWLDSSSYTGLGRYCGVLGGSDALPSYLLNAQIEGVEIPDAPHPPAAPQPPSQS